MVNPIVKGAPFYFLDIKPTVLMSFVYDKGTKDPVFVASRGRVRNFGERVILLLITPQSCRATSLVSQSIIWIYLQAKDGAQ